MLKAPKFEPQPSTKLEQFPLQEWNGMLFSQSTRTIAEITQDIDAETLRLIDLSKYRMDRKEEFILRYNWKTFIEFYLELYHVTSFHPGLGNFVDCEDLTWVIGEGHSIQKVGMKMHPRFPQGAEAYPGYRDAISRLHGKDLPMHGAVWIYIFPTTMIEWHPLLLVISTVNLEGVDRCRNSLEFYHPGELMSREDICMRDLRAATSAYLETAQEDNKLGERMHEGRCSMAANGFSETGPYHMPLEAGMAHFHKLYRSLIGEALQDFRT